MLTIRSLHKTVSDGNTQQRILNNLDLSVSQGESIAITGDSGSGKSTLLNLIACLDKPDSGEIRFQQQDITRFTEQQADSYRKSQVGFVFQQFNLIDCLSVYDNIAFPAKLNGRYNAARITEVLKTLGLCPHRHKLPALLSGGEQQRVAIARALIHQPQLVLADEPTGNLDVGNSDIISELLFGLCESLNTTLIVVTHSLNIAQKAMRHVTLANGKLTEQV